MDDLINRQALKNVLINWQMEYAENGKDVERFETLGKVIDIVEQMPTAEPKKGKWIKHGVANSLYKCTACNGYCTVVGYADCIPEKQMYKEFKFCPNCGVKMEDSNE